MIEKYAKSASTHVLCTFAVERAGKWHNVIMKLMQDIAMRIGTIIERTTQNNIPVLTPVRGSS